MSHPSYLMNNYSTVKGYFDKYIGKKTPEQMSKHFGVTVATIYDWGEQLGFSGGFRRNTDLLTRSQMAELLGLTLIFSKSWEKAGFKFKRIGNWLYASEEDMIDFMQKHPNLWDYDRCDKVFFNYYEWFRNFDKSKQSFKRMRNWTKSEELLLVKMLKNDESISEMSAQLNRTEAAINFHLRKLGYNYIYK